MRNTVWKGVAGGLLAILLGYAGNVLAAQFNLRERVAILETTMEFIVNELVSIHDDIKELHPHDNHE